MQNFYEYLWFNLFYELRVILSCESIRSIQLNYLKLIIFDFERLTAILFLFEFLYFNLFKVLLYCENNCLVSLGI